MADDVPGTAANPWLGRGSCPTQLGTFIHPAEMYPVFKRWRILKRVNPRLFTVRQVGSYQGVYWGVGRFPPAPLPSPSPPLSPLPGPPPSVRLGCWRASNTTGWSAGRQVSTYTFIFTILLLVIVVNPVDVVIVILYMTAENI